MALFGRKKKKELEEEEAALAEKAASDKKFTKKLRDLSPENKKKRKEPPKPWGTKERVLVLGIFLATVLAASFLALTARGGGRIGKSLHLPDIRSLNIFKEQTIILEK